MEKKSNNARKFGFCKIKWEIQNYFAATCTEKWVIESPTFTIHAKSDTEWRLFLKANYINERHSVFAYLKKMEDQAMKEPMWVSWSIFFPWNGRYFEIECDFEKEKTFKIEMSSVNEFEKFINHNTKDTLVIENEIFVSSKDSQVYERSRDLGLKSLSQDLRVLCLVDKNCDLNLIIDGDEVRAHKGILYCRNKFLKKVIEKDGLLQDLPGVDVDAAKNVLGYLYTGNLDYVLRKPSFLMLHCIKYFGIKELEEYYEPEELELRSEFITKECILDFIIPVEKIEDSDVIIYFPSTRKDGISFEQVKDDIDIKKRTVSVSISMMEEKFPRNSYVELSIETSDSDMRYLQRKRCSDSASKLCFENFFPKVLFLKDATFTCDGNFHILCKFHTLSSRMQSIVGKKLHSDIRVDLEKHYQMLSDQMITLFESGVYSDFTLSCNGEIFRVHSYILSARSYVFRELFKKMKIIGKANSLDISSMTCNALRAFLLYIYCGKLFSYEIQAILQLYEAAERFYVLSLKHTCSDILQNNMESIDVKSVLNLAEKFKDYKLIASLKKFAICKKSDSLQDVEINV